MTGSMQDKFEESFEVFQTQIREEIKYAIAEALKQTSTPTPEPKTASAQTVVTPAKSSDLNDKVNDFILKWGPLTLAILIAMILGYLCFLYIVYHL